MRFGEDKVKLTGNLTETPASPERLNPKFRRGRTAEVIQKQKSNVAKKFQMELEEMRDRIAVKQLRGTMFQHFGLNCLHEQEGMSGLRHSFAGAWAASRVLRAQPHFYALQH